MCFITFFSLAGTKTAQLNLYLNTKVVQMLIYRSSTRSSRQSGYTLIELMITVAILSIVSAFAISSYQDYVMKSKVRVIYQEVSGYRVQYQMMLSGADGVEDYTLSGLNMPTSTNNCNFVVTAPIINARTVDALRCNIINTPSLSGEYISMDRLADGNWKCVVSAGVPARFLPDEC